jgi:DNA adenine methylase
MATQAARGGVSDIKRSRDEATARPFLKWAGGKSQLLVALAHHVPPVYGRYIEPFVGGGALFFYLRPSEAVLSDSNPELINCYRVVRDKVEELIALLCRYPYSKAFFYKLRSQHAPDLKPVRRAARLVYLNRTCFNGLYRVNKQGEFNVPFGANSNPTICDAPLLRSASAALQNAQIEEGDYRKILRKYARPGDFVYLDPPYHPVSVYSDFKRYTKEFFYEEDQVALAVELRRMAQAGVRVLLTNSNTEFTRRLYQEFPYEIINTKRNINCNGGARNSGQDLVVFATKPPQKAKVRPRGKSETLRILERFPGTRFMGSKHKVLDFIWESVKGLRFDSVLDAFAGSTCVSYLFKSEGKQVCSNDLLHFSYHHANALIANNATTISDNDLRKLLSPFAKGSTFIQDTFRGLYFSDNENAFLDQCRANVERLDDPFKKSMALSALVRACLKRRPRGIFTYVGERYDDGRPDMQLDLRQHFIRAVGEYNAAVFDNGRSNRAFNLDVFDLDLDADLVYMDPPYYSPHSDSDYVRRYHFIEGLVRNWEGIQIMHHTKTKKFAKYPTPFEGRESTRQAFLRIFEKFRKSIIVVSYSSNCLPDKTELAGMLKQFKKRVSVFQIGHTYSFGTQHGNGENANAVDEYVFVGS